MENKEDNTIFIEIGQRMQYYRKKANLTQEKLAEEIGLSPNHLSRIETGKHNPHLDVIVKIAKALDVPVDAFLEDLSADNVNIFLQSIKNDINGMSQNQLSLTKDAIHAIKKYNF